MRKLSSQLKPAARAPQRRAFTLIELLVVVLIMLLLAGISLPVIAPALDTRRLRETSRSITAFLNAARNDAMRNGRPVGVAFERYTDPASGNSIPGMSIILRQVEVPPPYAGDYTTSQVQVIGAGTNLQITGFPSNDVGWQNAVRVGDMVKLNYQGPTYQITFAADINPADSYIDEISKNGDPSSTPWTLQPLNGAVAPANLLAATAANPAIVPFQISRQPVKSAATPLQLPESVVIDLYYSGIGAWGSEFRAADLGINTPPTDTLPAIIMFSPSGLVDRVYGSRWTGSQVVAVDLIPPAPVHFLLGKRERLLNNVETDITAEGMMNFRDLENLWISVFPQSGLITSTEVAAVDPASLGTNAIQQSRALAQQGHAHGGR